MTEDARYAWCDVVVDDHDGGTGGTPAGADDRGSNAVGDGSEGSDRTEAAGAAAQPTMHFRSGTTVYSEGLRGGRLVGLGWNGAGFTPMAADPWPDADDADAQVGTEAFGLECDGFELSDGWDCLGVERDDRAGAVTLHLALRHRVRPVGVVVHTEVDGTAVLARWLTVTNRGDRPMALSRIDPWSGVLWRRSAYERAGDAVGAPAFRVGRFADDRWGHEGAWTEEALPDTGAVVAGRYRGGPHRHPLVTLAAVSTGELFIGQLGWSGGYRWAFETAGPRTESARAGAGARRIRFRVGPDAPAPQRVLSPGEAVDTPKVHLGMVLADLDRAVDEMHRHVRRVRGARPAGRTGLVESGIGPEQEMTARAVLHEIDAAADLGAEVFFLDAGWYTGRSADWHRTAGDWQVAARYPGGLAPFRERCHRLGLRFGLWMEPERVGPDSRSAAEHPERLARRPDGRPLRGLLDLSDDEVAAAVESSIADLVQRHGLDFFRLDHNVGALGAGYVHRSGGLPESHWWRYYDNLYALFGRLRRRFPDVVLETCASGGARSDLGMLEAFDHTWVTDWQLAPRSFHITNGMTLALPPELVDRHVGAGMNDHLRGDVDWGGRLALFGRPTVGWLHEVGAPPSAVQRERVRHAVRLYKERVRPWQDDAVLHHHTPLLDQDAGWGVLERSSRDRTRAVIGLFRLDAAGPDRWVVHPRGLSPAPRYRVTADNRDETWEVAGAELLRDGVTVRLATALTSEVLLVEPAA
ncbi:alpha-galactosidase [Nakamurella endophytica]|uniref:Alpha-galactosidase n=1 Tax=Nakamurella endophytica TaxID=1748367 RepID=A0A917SWG2_9ACTN|nr:alpha-galactosidase [Nakamurella endophytica]GGL99501.1 hypothetical protein GCM10011594_19340 [Nakamurella endophytica]